MQKMQEHFSALHRLKRLLLALYLGLFSAKSPVLGAA